MKKLFLISLIFLFGNSLFAKADKEVLIIRVEYAAKKTGMESRLFCNIGVSDSHSLHKVLTNQENTVQIKDDSGRLSVFTNEIDLMNYLFKLGYHLESTYATKTINVDYVNFVLVKE